MKADQWAGLVTQASPYILPAGAAVDQVNLSLTIPGQLTTRDGMRRVASTVAASDVLDCFPYESGGNTVLLALTASGGLVALPSPAYGPETPAPSEPPLTLTSSQTGTTYTQRFIAGQASETAPPAPPPPAYVGELFGGLASTTSWDRLLMDTGNWQGVWDPDGQYVRNDVVGDSGSLWICVQQDGGVDQPADEPSNPWRLYLTYFGGSAATPDYPDSARVSDLPLA
jgi:hypothetical protein